MESKQVVKKQVKVGKSKRHKQYYCYPFEVRLKLVKLHVEGGIPVAVVAREASVPPTTINNWVSMYRRNGEEGVRPQVQPPKGGWPRRLPEAVRTKIVEIKREHSWFGIKKISQMLRQLWLPGSPETVRKTLHEAGMMEPQAAARVSNNKREPRFFERATPNQLWQSDITSFEIKRGQRMYLIGFMDDYSRYVVGAEIFLSQTTENVIEVYRRARAEYGAPKEMLTDNGRQYVTWRGTSRFQLELKRDNVHHIRSQPKHPMTLGKIERFWETIMREFIKRAMFENFEQARERIRYWIKYYNHKRPHQGIEGICPADRFFEVRSEIKKTVQEGIAENVLEMALRGEPQAPFYMVGKMGDQSVVLTAKAGKLHLSVEDQKNNQTREMTYDLKQRNQTENQTQEHQQNLQRSGEDPGGPGSVDGALSGSSDLSGVGSHVDDAQSLAEPGDGRDVASAGDSSIAGRGQGAESSLASAVSQAAEWLRRAEASGETAPNPGERELNEQRTDGAQASSDHPQSTQRADDSDASGRRDGSLSQDVLPVGEQGAGRDDPIVGRTGTGETADTGRSGEGIDAAKDPGTGTTVGNRETERDGAFCS